MPHCAPRQHQTKPSVFDLLVVGGGPVGLVTALYAHRAGLSVAVAEPRDGPIDKACGEGLMPGAVRALADLGIHPAGREFLGIRYLDDRRSVDATFHSNPGLGVRRTTLHRALRETVCSHDIPIISRSVEEIEQGPGKVRADDLEARFLAAADGLHSPTRRRLGLDVPVSTSPRFGLRRHFEMAPWTNMVEVHWAAHLEAYVTPVSDNLVGVALLTSQRGSFEAQLQDVPLLAERLPAAAVSGTRGAGPLRQRSRSRVAGRVMLVGDASGYVDALTGEGIAVGFAEAKALVRCVAANRPDDYEAEWVRVTRTYRWLTASLLWSRNHGLASTVVPVAHRLPRVFSAAVQQLAK